MSNRILYATESYEIVGSCYDVHRSLGHGFLESVYKDALEIEFGKRNVLYNREQKFQVQYRGEILKHAFYADFTVYDKIILEVKSTNGLDPAFFSQTMNYLKASGFRLGILVNFGTPSLQYKRIVL